MLRVQTVDARDASSKRNGSNAQIIAIAPSSGNWAQYGATWLLHHRPGGPSVGAAEVATRPFRPLRCYGNLDRESRKMTREDVAS